MPALVAFSSSDVLLMLVNGRTGGTKGVVYSAVPFRMRAFEIRPLK